MKPTEVLKRLRALTAAVETIPDDCLSIGVSTDSPMFVGKPSVHIHFVDDFKKMFAERDIDLSIDIDHGTRWWSIEHMGVVWFCLKKGEGKRNTTVSADDIPEDTDGDHPA